LMLVAWLPARLDWRAWMTRSPPCDHLTSTQKYW